MHTFRWYFYLKSNLKGGPVFGGLTFFFILIVSLLNLQHQGLLWALLYV